MSALSHGAVLLTMGLGQGCSASARHVHEGTLAGMQIAKAAAQEDNEAAAQEVVLRIPALANYRAAQGDPRLLETLADSGWMISGAAYLAHVQLLGAIMHGLLSRKPYHAHGRSNTLMGPFT